MSYENYVRVLPGQCVWRDWYRWFIRLFDGRVIWFYQSDVAGFEVLPPYEMDLFAQGEMVPPRRYVHLFVELTARDHPYGTDS